MILFLKLFYTFFIIGMFTVGGGYAMLPLIQNEVVQKNMWISEQEFVDIVAISQMTPGPIGINSATYIGYSVIRDAGMSPALCVMGSFTSTLAVVLPSFLIVLSLCFLYRKIAGSKPFTQLMGALKPTVAGLIGAAALIMITPENFPDWKSWVIFALAFMAAIVVKMHPILILAIAGVLGYFVY